MQSATPDSMCSTVARISAYTSPMSNNAGPSLSWAAAPASSPTRVVTTFLVGKEAFSTNTAGRDAGPAPQRRADASAVATIADAAVTKAAVDAAAVAVDATPKKPPDVRPPKTAATGTVSISTRPLGTLHDARVQELKLEAAALALHLVALSS